MKIGDFIYNSDNNFEKGQIRNIDDNIYFIRWQNNTECDISYHQENEVLSVFLTEDEYLTHKRRKRIKKIIFRF